MIKNPNILILLADQLRRNSLGTYGDPNIKTPGCDSLAQGGVVFSAACSTYPVCVPFRFSLMTGQYAHTRAVPAIEYRMSPSERTLADEFNEAGYETVYIGKWHLYGSLGRKPFSSREVVGRTPVPKLHQGRWQKWRGFDIRNNHSETLYFVDEETTPRRLARYQTDGLFDAAIEYLKGRRESDKSFCMVVSVESPHPPDQAPEGLMRKWMKKDIVLPPNFSAIDPETRMRWINQRKIYYAMIENLDNNIERISSCVIEEGLQESTVIVMLSDHGELGGSHGKTAKQHPFEESLGIPLIVSNPEYISSSPRRIDDPVNTEDLFPTLLGLAGLKPRDKLCGCNLAPLIMGEQETLDRDGVLLEFVAEHRSHMPYHNQAWRGFRTKRFKYTVLGGQAGGQPWQLFDLHEDPFEMKNLISSQTHAHEAARLHGLLRKALIDTQDHYLLAAAYGHGSLNIPDIPS
jgi:arylsulfatase A-like enzyme